MECPLIQPELVLYHFGTIAPDMRVEVERHLLDCRECLAGFVALKRHLETDADAAGPRPSPQARLRLRAAVERELAPRFGVRTPWRRATSWGIAAAAAAALAVVAIQTQRPPSSSPALQDAGISVDSANPAAGGLSVL